MTWQKSSNVLLQLHNYGNGVKHQKLTNSDKIGARAHELTLSFSRAVPPFFGMIMTSLSSSLVARTLTSMCRDPEELSAALISIGCSDRLATDAATELSISMTSFPKLICSCPERSTCWFRETSVSLSKMRVSFDVRFAADFDRVSSASGRVSAGISEFRRPVPVLSKLNSEAGLRKG